MNKTIVSTAAALSAAALTFGLAGSASADSIGDADPLDTFHGSDLRSVVVNHNENNLVVKTTHEGLRRNPATGADVAIYIDTDRRDEGPEYVFAGGLFEGTDYFLLKTEGFGRQNWGGAVDGDYDLDISYKKDRARVWMSRDAIGNPAKVRVAVKASGVRTDGTSHGLTDWLDEKRSFTEWVAHD